MGTGQSLTLSDKLADTGRQQSKIRKGTQGQRLPEKVEATTQEARV